MYGGSHKYGRGGGGGGGRGGAANKRNSFPPPPPHHRPSSANRLSLSSRKPSSSTTTTTTTKTTTTAEAATSAANQSEESFSLIGGNSPSFAAIIRLAPDLVDEIKRVESLGGAAKIKFDSNPTNNSANVIDVGGKEFRFTWSHDMGDLCDIYEERQNGEDGNGLLIESGCSWRKLNVQRVLDESTKKHVKKRSEEYEQKHKSRKAIVLDHGSPSMKKQIPALAAAEATSWKFKSKNKRFFEPSPAGGPPKPVKPPTGLSSNTSAKGRHSTSPLPSPQNQSLASSFVRGNPTDGQSIAENPTSIHARAKDSAVRSDTETPAQVSGRMPEASVHRENQGAGTSDLQNLLITSLKENPKGMSIKQLEKAVGDITFNSSSKIEPILRKIATYEHPGRYILKSGVELESSKRLYSDGGSSPDDNNQKQFVPEDSHVDVDLGFGGKSPAEDFKEYHVQNIDQDSNIVEKYDATQQISDLFGDDEPPDQSERQADRPNDSESGSDSDSSSGSGSDSASRSRSRSPAGSRSASSSDSDGGDSSSNSKEASDVEVDIMDDGDKAPKNVQEHGLSTTPVPWNMPEHMPLQGGGAGDQDDYASEDIDIENDFIDDAPHNPGVTAEKLTTISPDHDQNQRYDRMDVSNEQEDVEDEFLRKHHSSVNSGAKSKRGSNVIQFDHGADDAKRFKGTAAHSSIARHMGSRTSESPLKLSSDIANEDNYENHNLQIATERDKNDGGNVSLGVQRGQSYNAFGRPAVESLQTGQKSGSRVHSNETAEKAVKNPLNLGNPPNFGTDLKFQETNAYAQEGILKNDEKGHREAQDEEYSSIGNANGKFKESSLGQKHSLRPDTHHKRHGERSKKSNALGTSSRLQSGSFPKDGVKADFDRSPAERRKLQRESSDLELGELREPLPEESESTKKQFERGGSFKQPEMKLSSSGSRVAELKGKPVSKPFLETVNTSPNARGAPNNPDSLSRWRSPEPIAEDFARSHGAPQSQQQLSRSGRAEVGPVSEKAVDRSKLGNNELIANQGNDVEGYGETQKKSNSNVQREEPRKESSSRKGKGSKSKKSNTSKDASDRRKSLSNNQGHNDKRKRRISSTDENNSYSKYEKDEPDLKGPIKNISQYKEYVLEYREKYESYCSLNKILESYRNEFQKLGMDLDSAKGTDTERYYGILAQLKESYRQCGMRHKRLKKIFLVLHEELKQLKQMIKDFAVDYMKE